MSDMLQVLCRYWFKNSVFLIHTELNRLDAPCKGKFLLSHKLFQKYKLAFPNSQILNEST